MKRRLYGAIYEAGLDFDTLEVLAAKGRELPRCARLEDVYAYEAMKCIYSSWRRGETEREQARAERQRVKNTYEKAKRLMLLLGRAHKQVQDSIRRSEGMRRELLGQMKEDSGELACNALLCIGHMRCDEVFILEVKKHFGKSG